MPTPRSRPSAVEIILASAQPDDSRILRGLLGGTAWTLITAHSFEQTVNVVHRVKQPIVLLDGSFENQSWKDCLRQILAARAKSCVILLVDESDGHLFGEITRQGGFDLLVRPFDKRHVIQCLFFAYSRWTSVPPAVSLARSRTVQSREVELVEQ